MKLYATFPPRRDGKYPPIRLAGDKTIPVVDGVCDVSDPDVIDRLLGSGNFSKKADRAVTIPSDANAKPVKPHEQYDAEVENTATAGPAASEPVMEFGKTVQAGDADTMIITNGEESIDLMKLDKAALLVIAQDQMGLDVDHRNGEKSLRDAIFAFATAE